MISFIEQCIVATTTTQKIHENFCRIRIPFDEFKTRGIDVHAVDHETIGVLAQHFVNKGHANCFFQIDNQKRMFVIVFTRIS